MIIVGTHLDKLVSKDYPDSYLEHMQQLLRKRYIDVTEHEKSGLPRIVGHVEVSCKPAFAQRDGLSTLYELIMNTVLTETGSGTLAVMHACGTPVCGIHQFMGVICLS